MTPHDTARNIAIVAQHLAPPLSSTKRTIGLMPAALSAIGMVIAAVLLTLFFSRQGSTTTNPPVAANSCQALVGKAVNPSVRCVAPISGLTSPTAFPCAGSAGGQFYYFNLDSKEYVYGIAGGNWAALPYTESLGPVANQAGC